jgi:glycosyltransferase involved in cell wall biosynthesis
VDNRLAGWKLPQVKSATGIMSENSLTQKDGTPKIAIVHEWLVTYAGSERVIEQILKVFPQADLFCLIDILPQAERSFLGSTKIKTSFLQSFPFKKELYRHYLPFMPFAVEQLDLSGYDVVISNCHAVSKGVMTGPEQLHISYIHTPIRYAWDMQEEYLRVAGSRGLTGLLMRLILHYIRLWDLGASRRPDVIFGNSSFIVKRIKKTYRREARVLYPPVDTDFFSFQEKKQDYYLTASRLVPYKRVDLIVKAFEGMPDKKLVVIGDGPERRALAQTTPNIQWIGYQDAPSLRTYMQNARAFVFAAREDFGITPLEAQACGTPVIAFGQGGVGETISGLDDSASTGVFFMEQDVQSIREAVRLFESNSHKISPRVARRNAERFSNDRFQREVRDHVTQLWNDFKKSESI